MADRLLLDFCFGSGSFICIGRCCDSMLIKQVDGLDVQPHERPVYCLPYTLRPTVSNSAVLSRDGVKVETELGGDHHPVAERAERLADYSLFVKGP